MSDGNQPQSRGIALIIVYAVIGYVASFVLLVVAESNGKSFGTIPQVAEFLRFFYAPLIWPLRYLFSGIC